MSIMKELWKLAKLVECCVCGNNFAITDEDEKKNSGSR